jgi:uncharacterized protein (TIGR03067 family)
MRAFALMMVLLGVLGTLAARAADDDPEPPGDDMAAFLGEWELASIKFIGKDVNLPADALKMTMTFGRGKSLKMSTMGMTKDGKWQIGTNKKPKHIDITDDGQRNSQAIYKLEKDQLTICTPENPGGERPRDFTTAGVLLVLKRKKK